MSSGRCRCDWITTSPGEWTLSESCCGHPNLADTSGQSCRVWIERSLRVSVDCTGPAIWTGLSGTAGKDRVMMFAVGHWPQLPIKWPIKESKNRRILRESELLPTVKDLGAEGLYREAIFSWYTFFCNIDLVANLEAYVSQIVWWSPLYIAELMYLKHWN